MGQNTENTGRTTTETLELLRRYADGDTSVESRIMELNSGLVNGIAHRFKGRGTDFEDLQQIAFKLDSIFP